MLSSFFVASFAFAFASLVMAPIAPCCPSENAKTKSSRGSSPAFCGMQCTSKRAKILRDDNERKKPHHQTRQRPDRKLPSHLVITFPTPKPAEKERAVPARVGTWSYSLPLGWKTGGPATVKHLQHEQ